MIRSEYGQVDMNGTGADIMADITCVVAAFLEEAPRPIRGIIAEVLKKGIDRALELVKAGEDSAEAGDNKLDAIDELILQLISGYKEDE